MSNQLNITRIKAVYSALEEIADEVVFVGGATVALYADRPAAESRPTEDVDILVEVIHYRDYGIIEERLRLKGFVNDTTSGVICRYVVNGIIVDVMPTGENVLGFSNNWYKDGFVTSVYFELSENDRVRIFKPVYFLATKLVAFNNRGGGDGRVSSDFEDIIFVLNNRNAIWQELREAEEAVTAWLKEQFKALLANTYIDEWIASHLEYNEQRRVLMIKGELMAFVEER
jgi:hypothetical protein